MMSPNPSRTGQNSVGVTMSVVGWVCAAILAMDATPTLAQTLEVAKLVASDAAQGDQFGWSVSVSGDLAVIGAYLNDDAGSGSGSAYVYRYDPPSGDWIEVAKLTASDAAAGDAFGESVSVSGDLAVIGAPRDSHAGSGSGSAYLYRYDPASGDWIEEAKLTASDAAVDDRYGESVSVSGGLVVIGADGDDDGGSFSGSAYVYRYDLTSRDWIEEAKLTAHDAAERDFFGQSVSVSGDLAVIGAYGDDDAGNRSGSAYVYRYDPPSGDWIEEAKLTASDAAAEAWLGRSVSVSDDLAVIGAIRDSHAGIASGAAYLYRYDLSSREWIEQAKLTASDAAVGDFFGHSVSVSGDLAVIGAWGGDDAGIDSGSAYVYRYDPPSGHWIEEAKLTASDAAAETLFGYSVSVSGDLAVIGAIWDDDACPEAPFCVSGSAYVFPLRPIDTGELEVTGVVVQGTPVAGRSLHVEWDVRNNHPDDTVGVGFFDAVYLSSDAVLDSGDVRLTLLRHDEPVGPQESYHATVDVTLPGVLPGTYQILVRTDALLQITEPDGEENNVIAADPIFVDVDELIVGTPEADAFTDAERARYYQLTVVEGEDLEIRLDDLDDAGINEFYASFGVVPTGSRFEYRGSTLPSADQLLRIPGTRSGTYFIHAVASDVPEPPPSEFTILAGALPLLITNITPNEGWTLNTHPPLSTIEGSAFDPGATVVLRRQGQPDIPATDLTWLDTGTILARFNVFGAEAGPWDVIVENPDTQTASSPFNVLQGGLPNFEARMILPSALGFHIAATLYIEYANTGTGTMPAPLLTLHGSQDALLTTDESMAGPGLWTSSPPPGLHDTVQALALGSDPDPEILKPGDSGRIAVYYRGLKFPWNFSRPPIEFSLGVLYADDATPIDLPVLKDDTRPKSIPADAWDAIFDNLTTQIGDTWGAYVKTLAENAAYLHGLGQDVRDIGSLLAFEIAQASSLSPHRSLAGSVDTYSPAPGMPLVFTRVFGQTIDSRYESGPLGRGWTHNWDINAQDLADGKVFIHGPTGLDHFFTPDGAGGLKAVPGESATLTRLGGNYRLTEKNGTAWQFRSDNRLDYVEDTNGNRVAATYSSGLLTQLDHSNGDSLTLNYDGAGRITDLIDTVGRITTYSYAGEHLADVTAPGNRVTTYTYETAGSLPRRHALLSVAHPGGSHDHFAYDDFGRLSETSRDGGTESVTYANDSAGTLTLTDATGRNSVLSFGEAGQLAEAGDGEGNAVNLAYDLNRRLKQLKGADGQEYHYSYDRHGNVFHTQDPLAHTTSFTYAPIHNRLASVTDARANRIDYLYDSSGNVTSITYEDATSEAFTYDAGGNVITGTNRRGDTVIYTYNAAGQVTSKDYPDTPGFVDYQYTYDTADNLASATDVNGTTTMGYDADTDLLTRIDFPGGQFFIFEYDAAGRRTARTDQAGHVLNYLYDAIGRLDRMTDGANGLIVDYDYDPAGRLSLKTLGNGVYTTYEYDNAGRPTHLINYKPDVTVLSRFDYIYDASGRRTSMTTLGGTFDYGYDALGQLTSVTYPDGHSVTYMYDSVGNRIRVVDDRVPTVYTTNDMNQYSDVGSVTYTHDADGNMTRKTEGGVTTNYTYDIKNRVIGVTTPTDSWAYAYDALGHRSSATHNGVETRYVTDPVGLGDVVAEYDATNQLVARYDHGLGLVIRTDTIESHYYTFDGIGSTSELTDVTAEGVNNYTYGPFGLTLDEFQSVANPFRYVGEYGVMNESNGLLFMRNRFFAPDLGRFTSEDPVGRPSANTYTYALNSPLAFIDPSGLDDDSTFDFFQGLRRRTDALNDIIDDPLRASKNDFDRYAAANRQISTSANGFIGDLAGQVNYTSRPEKLKDIKGPLGLIWSALRGSGLLADRYDAANEVSTPDPPTQPAGEGSAQSVGSHDPNDKVGPSGFSNEGFIPPDLRLDYTVYFENESDATAGAREVRITDQLDGDLDWTSFEQGEIAFGAYHVPVPGGLTHFETSLAVDGWTFDSQQGWHTGETPLIVDIEADLNTGTGLVTWSIVSYDPNTGLPPQDPFAGFLPPDDPSDMDGRGEGHFSYVIRARPGLPTGTQITNQASIVFDFNPPIDTPATLNTTDRAAPSSSVAQLPATTETFPFTVEWTGQDDVGGSGIASYDLYVSVDGGPFGKWLTTPEVSAVLNGQPDRTYAFYTVATDNVGHREAPPAQTDATTTVFINMVNQAPVAVCQDVTVSADVSCQGTVTEGDVDNGSSDPDGDPITYALNPSGPYALGDTVVTLTVTDDKGAFDTCMATITVADDTPPAITQCPANQTVSANSSCSATVPDMTADVEASDNCTAAANLTVAQSPTGGTVLSGLGTTTVTFTVSDESGNSSTCTADFTIEDTTPPVISNIQFGTDVLWAPDHKFVNVGLTFGVSDDCDFGAGITTTVEVWSDETEVPDTGDGTGRHAPDFKTALDADPTVTGIFLRKERRGREDGRVYMIVFRAEDLSGNVSFDARTVVVPHDQSQDGLNLVDAQAAVDLGTFDGTSPTAALPTIEDKMADLAAQGWIKHNDCSCTLGPHQ